jgi:hypothetical protein
MDDSTKFLKGLGYNVVRVPRAKIAPLQLIGLQKAEAIQLGRLDQLLAGAPAQPFPAIALDEEVSTINGQRSSDLSASLGLNVLGAIIGAMGGNLGVKAQYKSAKTITFEYANVLSDSVEPLAIGAYLRDANVDFENKVVEQYVLGNGRLYVITRTVKSTTFRVEAKDSNRNGIAVDIPAIKGIVGGNIDVTSESAAATTVTYTGTTPLVFGFQCFDLGVRDGVLSLTNTPAGGIAMADEQPQPASLVPDGLVTMLSP